MGCVPSGERLEEGVRQFGKEQFLFARIQALLVFIRHFHNTSHIMNGLVLDVVERGFVHVVDVIAALHEASVLNRKTSSAYLP